MVTHGDKRAASFLLGLALVGAGIRWLGGPGPPGEIGYQFSETSSVLDSVAKRAEQLARPLARGERIDIDVATAEELTRLPRIGPGLANRIVRDREARGPFGSLEALERVSGLGQATLELLSSHVSFSRVGWSQQTPRRRLIDINVAGATELATLPGIGPSKAAAIVEDRSRRGRFAQIEELARVSGIGPAIVERVRPYVRVS